MLIVKMFLSTWVKVFYVKVNKMKELYRLHLIPIVYKSIVRQLWHVYGLTVSQYSKIVLYKEAALFASKVKANLFSKKNRTKLSF